MSTNRAQTYRFTSQAHWNRCLTVGFDAPFNGNLTFSPRIGAYAVQTGPTAPLSAVAVDRFGAPTWRQDLGSTRAIGWLDDVGGERGPFQVGDMISRSSRLQLDRYWLWAFGPDRIERYDRRTLQRDRTFALVDLGLVADARILDIATDGVDGVWMLLEESGRHKLAQVDCRGCVARKHWLVPCEVKGASQLATVDRGRTLVVLSPDDLRLSHINAADGALRHTVWLGGLGTCFKPDRISSNGTGRLGLAGISTRDGIDEWRFYLLDRFGESIQEPLVDPFRPPGMAQPASPVLPLDFAVAGDAIWFATNRGLWRLDNGDRSGKTDAAAVLLTPLLRSPAAAAGHGWSRAEIDIDLPEGASLEVSFATTNDLSVANRVIEIERDESLPPSRRQQTIWSLLDAGREEPRPFDVPGTRNLTGKVEIPLFSTDSAWLALKLRIDVPPFVEQPRLRGIRVLSDERSLMRHLPAIYSNPDNDPEAVLRRLVGVVEATTQQIDEKIASIGHGIDADNAPENWLDYLCSWLDLPSHPALASESKRELLRNAGRLLQWRGTARGVSCLLKCMAGAGAMVEINDITAKHGAILLGGKGRSGSAIAGLLAGRRRTASSLGDKAVLGRARLKCPTQSDHPLDIIVPTLRIVIRGNAAIKAANSPYLDSVLAQYMPAGVRHRVLWETSPDATRESEAPTLYAKGFSALGVDSRIGRTVLGGRSSKQIGSGVQMGFELR